MGFLDNSTITVDAILTKTGRQKLSQGTFSITRYALSDEEIDYTLYDVNHPNGTDSYGTVIENMNLLEAVPLRDNFLSYLVNVSLTGATLKIDNLNYTNVDANTIVSIIPSTVGAPAEDYSFAIAIGGLQTVRFKTNPSLKTMTGPQALLRAQEFGNPEPTATTTVTVTGINSGLVGIVTITVNATVGSAGDADGPEYTQTEYQKDTGQGTEY